MTRNTSPIGLLQQIQFWLHCVAQGEPRVFVGECCNRIVGYGIIAIGTPEHQPHATDASLLSGALLGSHRGFGLGKQLFSFLTTMAGNVAYLEVLKRNTAGFLTYRSVGYRTYAHTDKIVYMRIGVDRPKRRTASAQRLSRSSS